MVKKTYIRKGYPLSLRKFKAEAHRWFAHNNKVLRDDKGIVAKYSGKTKKVTVVKRK